MSRKDSSQLVHELLLESQGPLYAFVHSLLGSGEDVWDVLQETNIAILSKADEYDSDRRFLTWACRFAHFQVLAFRQRKGRSRLQFSEHIVDKLVDEFDSDIETHKVKIARLQGCVAKLSSDDRNALSLHYNQGHSLAEIGGQIGKTPGAVGCWLHRIRKKLHNCIQRSLAFGEMQ